MAGAPTSKDLWVQATEPLLHRAATLQGKRSGCAYVYAESVLVTRRLPTPFRHRLETSADPIGRILEQLGMAVTRRNLVEPIDSFPPEDSALAGHEPSIGIMGNDALSNTW